VTVVNPTKQERLAALQATGYIDQIQDWAKGCCAPVYYRDADGELHNGSMTFVDTGQAILGITAGHVADSIAKYCDGSLGHECQVGSAELDPARLIVRHPKLDLATFRLSAPFVTAASHHAATTRAWPPPSPAAHEMLLYSGYPAMYREERENQYDVSFVWFAGLVESVSNRNLGMALRIEKSLAPGLERVPANADLGGWSGGAVFRVIENAALARLELAGVIYEYSPASEIVLAHPLSCVATDGTFLE